ncbi:MAG: hypothetical protein JNG88_13185 [Phycisphaerales bacterium]|nr:hypothetical protein [Phycisphaerales bacterium]
MNGVLVGSTMLIWIAFNQSAAHWGSNLADAHLFGYFGWLAAQSDRPYLDFWDNKPPGIWWLNAAAFRAFGEGVIGEIVICGVAVGAAIAAVRSIAIAMWGRSLAWPAMFVGGLLLTHGRFECGVNRTETFVIALETLAVCCFLRSRGSPRRSQWAWLSTAGFCAGLAPLFKQAGATAAAACVVGITLDTIAARRAKRMHAATVQAGANQGTGAARYHGLSAFMFFFVAALLGPAAAVAELGRQGALAAAYFAVAEFNRSYFEVGDASWMNVPGATKLFWGKCIVPLAWPLVMVGVGAGLAAGGALRSREPRSHRATPERTNIIIIIIWGALAYYLATVGPGRQAYHFATTLPAIALLSLWPLSFLARPGGLLEALRQRPSAAALLVIFAAGFGSLTNQSLAAARRAWADKPHWYSLHRSNPTGYEQQSAAIRRHSSAGDRVYVWGWDPGAYRFAYRRPASRYATLEKGSHVGAHARFIVEGAMRDLRARIPSVFMIGTADWAGLQTGRDADFAAFIIKKYRQVSIIDGMILFVRELDRSASGS